MNGSSKKIGGFGSAFQQTTPSTSSKKQSKKVPIQADHEMVQVERNTSSLSLFAPSSGTTPLTSTTREESRLSHHQITQQSSSSNSSQEDVLTSDETTSPSLGEKSSALSAISNNFGEIESELLDHQSPPPASSSLHRDQSTTHRALRIFLREEMGEIIKYRFVLQEAQAVCSEFIKECKKESEIREAPLKDSLLHQAEHVFELQKRMVQETDMFVGKSPNSSVSLPEESLSKAFSMPLPTSKPRMLKYLTLLKERSCQFNQWLSNIRKAIDEVDQTDDEAIKSDREKAVQARIKILENSIFAVTAQMDGEETAVIISYTTSAKLAEHAALCWDDAAKTPSKEAEYLAQANTPEVQQNNPDLAAISRVMRHARESVRLAAKAYERASDYASSPEELLRQRAKDQELLAHHHDDAFEQFQNSAAYYAIGSHYISGLLENQATATQHAARCLQIACALEGTPAQAQGASFRAIGARYIQEASLLLQAKKQYRLAQQVNTEGDHPRAQQLLERSIHLSDTAFIQLQEVNQAQVDLEATFPAGFLNQLLQ